VRAALIGASSVAQLEANIASVSSLAFTPAELAEIDKYAVEMDINLWAESSEVK
jgi:L-glyceraldehyde 3-phosphate reductase